MEIKAFKEELKNFMDIKVFIYVFLYYIFENMK